MLEPFPDGRVWLHFIDGSPYSPRVFEVKGWRPDAANRDVLRPIVPNCLLDLSDSPEREALFEFADGSFHTHGGPYIGTARQFYDDAHVRIAMHERSAATIH